MPTARHLLRQTSSQSCFASHKVANDGFVLIKNPSRATIFFSTWFVRPATNVPIAVQVLQGLLDLFRWHHKILKNEETMGTFAVSTTIDAPIDKVWDRLADVGSIHEWNPGVIHSHLISGQGKGAQRHCDLGDKYTLDEEVVEFEDRQTITFRITKTNLPFQRADIRFRLRSSSEMATLVTCSPNYRLKYGLVGNLLDSVMVRRTYTRGMKNLLVGLKQDMERIRE